jgi:glutaredoxin/glutathione-dependent peroxiredoxin
MPFIKGHTMTIAVGQAIPQATLAESTGYLDAAHCPTGPNPIDTLALTKGKKVVIFGLPGAYTPTCSGQHVPGYVAAYEAFKAKGVDDVICMAVNDGFVMAEWGRSQNATGKVRMMGDGSAEFTKKLGLEFDLSGMGFGLRCQRFSMLVEDGVVKSLNVEGPGKFEVSNAETMLAQL